MTSTVKTILSVTVIAMAFIKTAGAVPYFARKYDTQCSTCHTLPPSLNQAGLDFVARGYRMEKTVPTVKTVPVAAWLTQRLDYRDNIGVAKSFPSRIEIISAGAVTEHLSYFVEWRPLSYEMTGSGRLRNRSGRFEDLFLILRLNKTFSLTAGQFRMLSQWDASRRLSLSTPLAFSSGLAGKPALNSRIGSLRSFSLEGRAPAIRMSAFKGHGTHAGDGWYHEITVPFPGEFSLPLGDEPRRTASFAIEGRPKGLFYETYYRAGISSIGGSIFAGDDRWMGNITGQYYAANHQLYGSVGTGRFRSDLQDFRLSVGDYWIPRSWFALGARLDHRSTDRLPPAFVPHMNLHFPGEKYTFMLVVEPFLQKRNSGAAVELSLLF